MQVDEAPHVEIDIVHLNSICDFFFVKLCPSREHIDVFIVEDTASSRISCNIEIRNSAPSVILDIILFASSVESLRVVPTNDKYKASL